MVNACSSLPVAYEILCFMLLHVFTYIKKYILMILKFLEQNTSGLSCVHVFIIMQKVSIVNF